MFLALNTSASVSIPVSVIASGTASICPGASASISAIASDGDGGPYLYLWMPGSISGATITVSPTITTTYTLRITNQQGCTNTSNVTIIVIPYCISPANAFTPNKDGFNDTWFITNGNCLNKAKVQVYNRYGGKVFESLDYKNNWDGTYKGKPVPDGTYYYVIDYELVNNTNIFKKGSVTILR